MTRDEYYSGIFNYKDKLVHQGIKGQKWGVRRWQYADGRFNDAGKERYFGKSKAKTSTNEESSNTDKALPGTPLETLNDNNDFVDGGKESKADKKAIKEAKKLEKEFMAKRNGYEYPDRKKIQDWIEDPKNKEFVDSYLNAYDKQYSAMSKEINELFKDYNDHDDDYYAKAAIYEALESNGDNLGDISSTVRWFVGDDGDQGSRNSRAYYLQEKGMSVEDIQELYKRQIAAENRARVDARLAIHDDKVFDKLNPNLQTAIDSELYWKYARNDNYTNTKMGDASEALGQDEAIVQKTQDIAKKLSPSCNDFSGWMVLNRAIENLNFDDKDYTELTDADWNRINAEVKQLKAKY